MVSKTGRGLVLILPLLAFLLGGCAGGNDAGLYDPQEERQGVQVPVFNVGDSIAITLDGPEVIPVHEEIIKENGCVTLAYIGEVKAAGKTAGELSEFITSKYVPSIYKRLTVTIKSGDRVFFVSGNVKGPGRVIYTGPITLTKAITSAGDFAEDGNRKNVVLTRADGKKRYVIDCTKILSGKKKDPYIYPGDQIEVKRRSF